MSFLQVLFFIYFFFFFTDIVSKYELLGVPLKIEYSNKLKVCRYNFLLSITFVGLVISRVWTRSQIKRGEIKILNKLRKFKYEKKNK